MKTQTKFNHEVSDICESLGISAERKEVIHEFLLKVVRRSLFLGPKQLHLTTVSATIEAIMDFVENEAELAVCMYLHVSFMSDIQKEKSPKAQELSKMLQLTALMEMMGADSDNE